MGGPMNSNRDSYIDALNNQIMNERAQRQTIDDDNTRLKAEINKLRRTQDDFEYSIWLARPYMQDVVGACVVRYKPDRSLCQYLDQAGERVEYHDYYILELCAALPNGKNHARL